MESANVSGGAGQNEDGTSTLSKNKLRKIRKYDKKREYRKEKRSLEKLRRKNNLKEQGVIIHRKFRGNDEKSEAAERLQRGLVHGPKVVIDCQYVNGMTEKERKRFAQQIRRAYSSNRLADNPLHLYLTSLSEESEFFRLCCQQNSGFASYVLDRTEQSVVDVFGGHRENGGSEQVIYLSPDSANNLTEFHPDHIYIIGGIVDETTTKNISKKFAERHNLSTARIPIDLYFTRSSGGTFKEVLTVNQVVDIILEWHRSKDWVKAIGVGLPQRAGFIPIQNTSN